MFYKITINNLISLIVIATKCDSQQGYLYLDNDVTAMCSGQENYKTFIVEKLDMRETGNAFISKFSLTSLLHWNGDTYILKTFKNRRKSQRSKLDVVYIFNIVALPLPSYIDAVTKYLFLTYLLLLTHVLRHFGYFSWKYVVTKLLAITKVNRIFIERLYPININ